MHGIVGAVVDVFVGEGRPRARARARLWAVAVLVLAPAFAATCDALAATHANSAGAQLQVPASARVQGTTASSTASTPVNGAQPGSVAPGSTVPTTSTPTAVTPTATVPVAPGASGVPTATTPPAGSPSTLAPGSAATPGSTAFGARTHRTTASRRLSGGALALAVLGALLVLACALWAAVRWMGLQPRWATATVYSLREATYHASNTWAEFSDWARLGH